MHSMPLRAHLGFLFLAVSVMLAFIFSPFQVQTILADNINEGFEGSLDGRYVHHGDNASFTHVNDSSQSHMGNRSLRIVSSNSTPGWAEIAELTRWMTPIQAYTVTPGDTITAEVWMRGEGLQNRADLSLTFFKENTTGNWSEAWVRSATSSTKITASTNGWTKLSVSYAAPNGAVYVRPEFRLFDRGTLYIDSFELDIESKQAPTDETNRDISVHETVGLEGPTKGAQVVLADDSFIWVTPDCKARLIEDGHEVTVLTWSQLDDNYTQLTTNSLTCDEVRFFTEADLAGISTSTTPQAPGSAEVIGPTPSPGGSNPDPVEVSDSEFDTSVVPHDPLINTVFHGINRHHEQQLFTIDCTHSHYANDDPIVFPGQHGASHSHEFFGDTQVNASTTVQDLLNNFGNTCGIEADRSAYWTPTAYQDGVQLKGDNNKFYYKAGPVDPSLIVDMPVGLKMIAGNANATGPQSPQVQYYFASRGKGKLTSPATQTTRGRNTMFTINETENGVRAKINFPQCWDGVNLWLPNSSHMAYPINTGKRYHECPATHPKPIVRIKANIGYTGATGGPGFTLSSGEWYTMHADFINGWKPEVLKKLTDTCIRGKRYCGIITNTDQCEDARTNPTTKLGCIDLFPDVPEAVISGATTFPDCHEVQGVCL